MMNRLTAALVGIGLLGCSSQVPLDNSKCPCPASLGYFCCDNGGATRCVRPTMGETCNPQPMADASLPLFDAGPQPIDASPEDAPPVLSPIGGIAIGRAHACGVRDDYTVTCMGDNSKGQATPPPGVLFYSVTASGDMTCGIIFDRSDFDKNGQTVCWGETSFGQTAMPAGVLGAAAGLLHACGYDTNGNIVCWGDNSLGQTDVPSGPLTNLTVGHNHNCAIRPVGSDAGAASGTIVCWGDNSLGQTMAHKLPMLTRRPAAPRAATTARGSTRTSVRAIAGPRSPPWAAPC